MTDPRIPLGPGGSHPEEALAAFTDGTATADERALVLQHLQGCAACRADVEGARAALAALSALPEPASPGLDPEDIVRRAGNVTAIEPGRRPESRRGVRGLATGLVAVAAVAAVLAGVIKLSQGDSATMASGGPPSTAAGAGSSPNAPEAGPPGGLDILYGTSSINYTAATIDELARETAAKAASNGFASDHSGTLAKPVREAARSCVAPNVPPGATLVSVVQARFEGRRAFVAVAHSGSGDAGVVQVVVTDPATCSTLYETSHPVGG